MKQGLKFIWYLPRRIICGAIRLYQKTLSPDHGWFKDRYPYGYCKFYPTCSSYGYETIMKQGVIIGVPKTIYRILRCNPCSKGGVDLPK